MSMPLKYYKYLYQYYIEKLQVYFCGVLKPLNCIYTFFTSFPKYVCQENMHNAPPISHLF